MNDIRIRKARSRAEVERFAPILSWSLLFPPLAESDWASREGLENFRLAWSGKTLIGGLTVQPMGQWFGGRAVPTGAVRCVATAPEQRSKGVARALLRALLEELHERAIPLSTLYPSTQAFYRRSGWERAGMRTVFRLATASLPSRAPEGTVMTPLAETELPELEALYAERARRASGLLDRNAWLWGRLFRPLAAKSHAAWGVREGGRLTGYLSASVESTPGAALPISLLRVLDVYGSTPASCGTLLAFLAGHRSMTPEALLPSAPHEALWHLVPNQSYRPEAVMHWMLRLVDVPAALESRGWPAHSAGQVSLEIHDELLPWNHGRFVLEVAGGKAGVRRGGAGRVKLDVRALASLYTALCSPLELLPSGLVEGPRPDLERLASLLAGPTPWMPDMF